MNGTISIISEIDVGTEVEFTIQSMQCDSELDEGERHLQVPSNECSSLNPRIRVIKGITSNITNKISMPIANSCSKIEDKTKAVYTLVVDDNITNTYCLTTLLKKFGIESESAANGKEAIEKIYSVQRQYDKFLVFMDINMPVMNGIEATIKLHDMIKSNAIKECIIVAVSAQCETKETKEAEFIDYLSKPVSFTVLRSVLLKYVPEHIQI